MGPAGGVRPDGRRRACPAAAVLWKCGRYGAGSLRERPGRIRAGRGLAAAADQTPPGFRRLCPEDQPVRNLQARALRAQTRHERHRNRAHAQAGVADPRAGDDQQRAHPGPAGAETRTADRRRFHGDRAGADLGGAGRGGRIRQRDDTFRCSFPTATSSTGR